MKIVLTGPAGLLGKALIETAPPDVEWFLVYRTNLPSIPTNQSQLRQHDLKNPLDLSPFKPDLIIHCATEGSVDKIQKDPYLGTDSILAPTINIINEAERLKCKLIYLSTNAVFDGEKPPYKDNDQLCPINYYGIFKASCELAVRGCHIPWMVIRPLLMYGWQNEGQRKNWASIWIDKFRKKEKCQVVYDVISQPLYNRDCARAIWLALAQEKWNEIFNVAGADTITLYDFAKTIARLVGTDERLVEPVPSEYFINLAPRPRNTSYDLTKLHNLGHKSVAIEDGIQEMLQEQP
jgi:dTDP-4-dehydrorhamnose reductase